MSQSTTVLVTGGAGLIGSHIVDAALAKGWHVRILDALERQTHLHGPPSWLPPEAEFIHGDVRQRRHWERALDGVDVVFHQAAYGGYMPEIAKFIDVNAVGTALMLETIRDKELPVRKVVVASSQAVYNEGAYACASHGRFYGSPRSLDRLKRADYHVHCPICDAASTPVPTDEQAPIGGENVYAISKAAQERLVVSWGRSTGIPVVALRYSCTYGPRQSVFRACLRTPGRRHAIRVYLALRIIARNRVETPVPQRSSSRDQVFLLPPSLDEWTPLDHPARFVAALLESLSETDWRAMTINPVSAREGAPRYAPELLTSVWVYGFMSGIRSARKLERACQDQIPVRWLTGNQCPDHTTLWRFYKDHRTGMRSLLKRSIRVAVQTDVLDLALMAVDGTKLRANAAVERSVDAKGLSKLLERTEHAIARLEAQNEAGDEPPPSLPEKLRKTETLREQVRQALAYLEEEGVPGKINLTGLRTKRC